MKKNSFIKNVLFLLSSIVISCLLEGCYYDDQVVTNAHTLDIPIKQMIRTNQFDLNHIIENVAIVELGGNEGDGIIGSIRDIKLIDDYIFVSDGSKIHIYDTNGTPLYILNRKGRGHGEYLSLKTFDVDATNKRIIIYDSTQHKLLYYSFECSFLKETKIDKDFSFFDFAVMPNSDILCYYPKNDGIGPRGLWLSDSNCVFKKQLVEIEDSYNFRPIRNKYLIHINDSCVGLMGGEDKNIFYSVNNGAINEEYYVKCDIRRPKRLIKKRIPSDNEQKMLYTKDGYLETDNTLFFDMIDGESKVTRIIVDKHSNTMYRIYDGNDIIVQGIVEILPYFRFSDHNRLIGYYSANTILSNNILKEAFPNIDENSNPVLFLVTTKPIN